MVQAEITKEHSSEDPTWEISVTCDGETRAIPIAGASRSTVISLIEALRSAKTAPKTKKLPAWVSKVKVAFELITPQTALKYLAAGAGAEDRPPNMSRVLRYAQTMARGEWLVIGDPIVFDTKGQRLNGKNRLIAIIASGEPGTFCVMRGLPAENQKGMDQGWIRGSADWLHHKYPGIPHKDITSPIINRILTSATGYNNFYEPSSAEAIAGMYERDLVWLKKVMALDAKQNVPIFKKKEILTAFVIAHHYKARATERMVQDMIEGEVKAGTPARLLRDYLVSLRVKFNDKRGNSRDRMILALRCIVGHMQNEVFAKKIPKAEFDDVLSHFVVDRRYLIPEGVFDEQFAKKAGERARKTPPAEATPQSS